jgi:hypothetical protein
MKKGRSLEWLDAVVASMFSSPSHHVDKPALVSCQIKPKHDEELLRL